MSLTRTSLAAAALVCAVITLSACSAGLATGNPPAASDKALTAFSLVSPPVTGAIDETAKTVIVAVPHGTEVKALVAAFTTSGAKVTVAGVTQVSGTTPNDFTSPVAFLVTAADASTVSYTVTVKVSPSPAKAITAFSLASPAAAGAIDETAKTIAATVPFGTDVKALVAIFQTTGASVKVGSTAQASGTTPNDFTNPVVYVVTAADASTASYTVTVKVSPSPAKAITAFSFTNPAAAGSINQTAKTIAVTVPFGTDVRALVATFQTTGASVKVGSTDQASGTTPNDFTHPVVYLVTAADGSTSTYTVTVAVAKSAAKALTAFSFATPAATGSIEEGAKAIAVAVPYATDVKALVAAFVTTGVSVKVGATAQVSGTTPNDFTSPVTYVVTADDGTSASYVVTVTAAEAPKALTKFSFPGHDAAGTIDEAAKTVAVTLPFGLKTALIAAFETTGAVVRIGSATQTTGATVNDFSAPVGYVVEGADGKTATYTVTVTVPPYHLLWAYSTNSTSKTVSEFDLGASGALTVKATPTIGAGSLPAVAAVAPSGKYLYVGDQVDNAVYQYAIGADGVLSPLSPAAIATGTAPTAIAVHPTGRFAYVTNAGDGTVSQYAIGATGALAPLTATAIAANAVPRALAIDPSGRFLYVGNETLGQVTQFTIGADGVLAPMATASVPAATGTYGIAIDPWGRYAYAVNQGADSITQYSIGANGGLVPLAAVSVGASGGPIAIVIDPGGKHVYASTYGSYTILQYDVGADGALSPMATPSVDALGGDDRPMSLCIEPMGRFVYASHSAGAVSQYTVGADGSLTAMTPASVTSQTMANQVVVAGRYY